LFTAPAFRIAAPLGTLHSLPHRFSNSRNHSWHRTALLSSALPLFSALLPPTAASTAARAQEPPYFVTYSQVLEEPGNLEIAQKGLTGSPKDSNAFYNSTLELEYGAKAWWTTELYLQGQATAKDSAIFTGFRWENRFRVLPTERWINPVLYLEYEDVNGADKSVLEVTGHDSIADFQERNADSRGDISRTIEGKLILSSEPKGWDVSENWIMEKNMMGGAWEFGYALGASRPLAFTGGSRECTFCRQNFSAGAELYGGLATVHDFGLHHTSHYAGPTMFFNLPHGPTLGFSPQFGLSSNSAGILWRVTASYEVQQFRDLFRSKKAR